VSARPADLAGLPREVILAKRVARALWLLSATLVALLVVWSL
jgi:hypothetical protein